MCGVLSGCLDLEGDDAIDWAMVGRVQLIFQIRGISKFQGRSTGGIEVSIIGVGLVSLKRSSGSVAPPALHSTDDIINTLFKAIYIVTLQPFIYARMKLIARTIKPKHRMHEPFIKQ